MRTLVDLSQQRSGSSGATEDPAYHEILNAVEAILSKKPARITISERQKHMPIVKEEPTTPKAKDLPITEENGMVVCNFEFACYLSRMVQKTPVILYNRYSLQ
jgi:hypothetical protein